MPTKPIAGYTVRVWITNADLDRLKSLSEATELSQSELMTRIMHAGIEAVSVANRLSIPLRFRLEETMLQMPDPNYTQRPPPSAVLNDKKLK